MLLVIALFLVFKSKGGTGLPVWAMGLNSLAMGIVFGIGLFFIRVTMPKAVWVVPQPSYEPSIWLRVSLPLLLLTGMHMLMEHIGVILVGSLAGSQGAGLLAAAERVSHFVIFGLVASNTILAPMISEFYHKQKWKKLQRILTITARGVFFFTLFFAILLIIFGPWVMNLFGEGFGKAYVPLIIIVIGQMVSSCSGPAGETMVMTGHQDQAALIMGGAVAITVLLSLALVPIYNATGGAIALCAGTGFWNVSMVVYLRRKINLNTTILNF
jgi:O-antigen/teichoic acid export membrane protein